MLRVSVNQSVTALGFLRRGGNRTDSFLGEGTGPGAAFTYHFTEIQKVLIVFITDYSANEDCEDTKAHSRL